MSEQHVLYNTMLYLHCYNSKGTAWPTIIQEIHALLQVHYVTHAHKLLHMEISHCGISMTLCGTHRGVQVGALAVVMVVHGSLPH